MRGRRQIEQSRNGSGMVLVRLADRHFTIVTVPLRPNLGKAQNLASSKELSGDRIEGRIGTD